MLPDDVLVGIFNFYVNIDKRVSGAPRNSWHALVHVCSRWRYLVFASPRRLNLRLEYGGCRPISRVLDAWPVLPVTLLSTLRFLPSGLSHPKSEQWFDNSIAALESEHYNRIREIRIFYTTESRLERFAAAMQKPFPELTCLELSVFGGGLVPVLPDSSLGGSAPRLRDLWLSSIPLPSMPKLLLSANGLLTLSLQDIPDSGDISPNVIVTALAAMTRLETLRLQFRSLGFYPHPASRSLPLPTRFVLPALTKLIFEGNYKDLEVLLSRIDSPLLYDLHIAFFMGLNFDVPQLRRLIGHAEAFKTFDQADVLISYLSIQLRLYPKTGVVDHHSPHKLQINIKGRELSSQLSSLAQVCSSFPLISTLEELEIRDYGFIPSSSHWYDDMENAQWLELLHPFTALKNLYLTDEFARRVCGALQELPGERATEVLPALRNLFVQGTSLQTLQEAMMPFVAARQLYGHPMVVDRWGDRIWLA